MAQTLTQDDLDAITLAVWNAPYAGYTAAGTFGKLMDLLRKSNLLIEGTVSASPTPTTTAPSTALTRL
jgi:hypothetical protein